MDFGSIVENLQMSLGSELDFSNENHLNALVKELKENQKWSDSDIKKLITGLLITELEFSNKGEYKKYRGAHNLRPTTKVTIGNKKTTVGDLDGTNKIKEKPVINKKQNLQKPQINKKDKIEKNKTLKNVNTTKSKVYTEDIFPKDSDFDKKNKKYDFGVNYKIPKLKNFNFPKKYISLINRLANTSYSKETSSISYFISGDVGAGEIRSQVGELLTVAAVGMSDQDFSVFYDSLLNHTEYLRKNKKDPILNKSWVIAMNNTRISIKDRLNKQYPKGTKIDSTAWDTKGEVEAMGLNDYATNKGYSTDMYIKLKMPSGKTVLDEVSLKKDEKVNFLNSGTGMFEKWDKNLDNSLRPNIFKNKQYSNLVKQTQKTKNKLIKILNSKKIKDDEFINRLKKAGITDGKQQKTALDFYKKISVSDIEDAASEKGNMRAKSKTLLNSQIILTAMGDKDSSKFINNSFKESYDFSKRSIEAISTNEKLKSGMLNSIRSEFPLKSISIGEESMAIGSLSFDQFTMKEIFGTTDYNKIKENLIFVDTEPPYIGYRATVGKTIIPISEIKVREDGVGYGGQFKFEMKLDSRFAKILKKAHAAVYKK